MRSKINDQKTFNYNPSISVKVVQDYVNKYQGLMRFYMRIERFWMLCMTLLFLFKQKPRWGLYNLRDFSSDTGPIS